MKNKKCCMIQCKISADTAERIDEIVKRGGFSSQYEFLQYLLSAFMRYAEPEKEGVDEMSEDLLSFAQIFEGWENKKNRIITTKPSGNRALKMTESVNIYSELGRKGYVSKMIKVKGEEISTTSSIALALETIMKRLYPKMYCQILDIGRNIGEESVQRVIEYMIEEAAEKGLTAKEKAVSANPTSNEYGNVPKKKRSKSLNDE